jgi:hypothetical protein
MLDQEAIWAYAYKVTGFIGSTAAVKNKGATQTNPLPSQRQPQAKAGKRRAEDQSLAHTLVEMASKQTVTSGQKLTEHADTSRAAGIDTRLNKPPTPLLSSPLSSEEQHEICRYRR